MNVPGRKNRVTRVIIRIETVSFFVFTAIRCMAFVIASIFPADICDFIASSLLASMLRIFKRPESYNPSQSCMNHTLWKREVVEYNLQDFSGSPTSVKESPHLNAESPDHP